MPRLRDKVALITGAGDGIGRGIALAFAREGAAVALCDLHPQFLEETASLVNKAGGEAFGRVLDVTQPEAIEGFVAAAADRFGRLDILVNNAAVMPVAETADLTPELVDRVLAVNLRAPILFTRACLPYLRAAGGGSVIHMASVTGHNGHPGITVYGATKGALIALAKGQAIELAPAGIRVNTVSPGTVNSPMLHRFLAENATDPDAARRAFDRLHPRGKVAEIEEVAAVFVFLASDEAANITATDIRCDGGYAVQGQQPRS